MIKKITTFIFICITALTLAQTENSYVKKGLFVDALIGGSSLSSHYNGGRDAISMFSFNARVGSKWYFGETSKFNSGIQLTWARLGFNVASVNNNYYYRQTVGVFNFIPLNVGYTSYLAFNDNMGLETNINVGPGFTFNKNFVLIGVHANPEIKFRYKNLAAGFDFSLLNAQNFSKETSYYSYWFSHNTYSLVFGLKF